MDPTEGYLAVGQRIYATGNGETIVFAFRRPAENHPCMYRAPPDPGDEFGFPRHSGRRLVNDGDDD